MEKQPPSTFRSVGGGVTAISTSSLSRPLADDYAAGAFHSYADVVAGVIAVMRERLTEPWTLDEVSRIAHLSPFHFSRIFRRVTGVPPFKFLAALRMVEARRLLLTTEMSVTEVCLDVGYRSLGTFTTHFRQLVGVGPRRLRRLAAAYGHVPLAVLCEDAPASVVDEPGVRLLIELAPSDRRDRVVFAGLFPTPLPQTRPSACAVPTLPTAALLAGPVPGPWYALASAYDGAADAFGALLAGEEDVRVGVAGPLLLGEPPAIPSVPLRLRPPAAVDPPILLALPLVLAEAAAAMERPPARARTQSVAGASVA